MKSESEKKRIEKFWRPEFLIARVEKIGERVKSYREYPLRSDSVGERNLFEGMLEKDLSTAVPVEQTKNLLSSVWSRDKGLGRLTLPVQEFAPCAMIGELWLDVSDWFAGPVGEIAREKVQELYPLLMDGSTVRLPLFLSVKDPTAIAVGRDGASRETTYAAVTAIAVRALACAPAGRSGLCILGGNDEPTAALSAIAMAQDEMMIGQEASHLNADVLDLLDGDIFEAREQVQGGAKERLLSALHPEYREISRRERMVIAVDPDAKLRGGEKKKLWQVLRPGNLGERDLLVCGMAHSEEAAADERYGIVLSGAPDGTMHLAAAGKRRGERAPRSWRVRLYRTPAKEEIASLIRQQRLGED